MSAIQLLMTSCKPKATFRRFEDIEVGVYNIEKFRFVETKFGKKLVVCTEEFMCFLPERCSKAITTDQQVNELNNGAWAMQYVGRDVLRGNAILVDIINKPEEYELSESDVITEKTNQNN